MLVLAIDTVSDACSVAIADVGSDTEVHARIVEPMARGHAEALLPILERAHADAGCRFQDIARIAVTTGPGSFTGLRVGLSAARALALAAGCPCVGIDVFTVIRQMHGPHGTPLTVALDARREELYMRTFQPDGIADAPSVVSIDEAMNALDSAHLVIGAGAVRLGRQAKAMMPVDPVAIAVCGANANPVSNPPTPLYLRQPDAKPQAHFSVPRQDNV